MLTLKTTLALVIYLLIGQAMATVTVSYVNVDNRTNRSVVTLGLSSVPIYTFFSLHNPERVVIDIHQCKPVQGLPLNFRSSSLIQRIRTSAPVSKQNLRLVLELTDKSSVQATVKRVDKGYNIVLTITSTRQQLPVMLSTAKNVADNTLNATLSKKKLSNKWVTMKVDQTSSLVQQSKQISANGLVVVAIDAGHGGQDPGAKGPNGLYEKNVTIAIARKLKALLDIDPMFKPVLTREGDYFIPVMGRSDLARKKGASVLVSIHADAAPNLKASGASVWILSNRRANSETANWLENHEKQSELLGGASDLLANSQADPYLSHTLLDLQFGHSQRVSYDIALKMLHQLQNVSMIHKHQPEHASLGVLRSPDIPSLLVETGFISNIREEKLLGNSIYQEKIASALHLGLRAYFLTHPISTKPKKRSPDIPFTVNCHIVQYGETLFGIASSYGINLEKLRALNKLKKDSVLVGQKLYIPATSNTMSVVSSSIVGLRRHKVVRGDTLAMLSTHYGVSAGSIMHANNMKSSNIMLGQILIIPHV